jgi:hypothetical protein
MVGGVTMRRALLALAVCVVMTGGAWAGPLEALEDEAQAAYERGGWATVIQLIRPLADQGNRDAQRILGDVYWEHQRNYAEALRWYRLAGEQGDGQSLHRIGEAYWTGSSVPRDYTQAYMWFTVAALRWPQGMSLMIRQTLIRALSAEQIAEAQRLAREWDAAHPAPAR